MLLFRSREFMGLNLGLESAHTDMLAALFNPFKEIQGIMSKGPPITLNTSYSIHRLLTILSTDGTRSELLERI